MSRFCGHSKYLSVHTHTGHVCFLCYFSCVFLLLVCFTFVFPPPNCRVVRVAVWSFRSRPLRISPAPFPFLPLSYHFEALSFTSPLSFVLSSCVDEIRWFLLGAASVHPSAAPSRSRPTSVQVIKQAGQTLLRLPLLPLLLFSIHESAASLHHCRCLLSCASLSTSSTVSAHHSGVAKHSKGLGQALIIDMSII